MSRKPLSYHQNLTLNSRYGGENILLSNYFLNLLKISIVNIIYTPVSAAQIKRSIIGRMADIRLDSGQVAIDFRPELKLHVMETGNQERST